jgi:hypothetical protein
MLALMFFHIVGDLGIDTIVVPNSSVQRVSNWLFDNLIVLSMVLNSASVENDVFDRFFEDFAFCLAQRSKNREPLSEDHRDLGGVRGDGPT